MRGMTVEERDLDPKQAFGERIRQLRGQKRLSAVKAGEAAGISREWWAMFEAGRRRDGSEFKPEAPTILNVAKVVGIPGDEALRVYGHDPAFFPQATAGRPLASAQELAAKVGKLTEEERAALVPIVDLLLQQRGHLPLPSDGLPTTGPLGDVITGEVEIGPEPIHEADRDRARPDS
jgi:transcriptional regulator with XRE-family HTH domain